MSPTISRISAIVAIIGVGFATFALPQVAKCGYPVIYGQHRKAAIVTAPIINYAKIAVPATTFQFYPAEDPNAVQIEKRETYSEPAPGFRYEQQAAESPESGLPVVPDEVPSEPVSGSDQTNADTIPWQTVLSNRCASCHTGSGSSGGFKIFVSGSELAPLTKGDLSLIALVADIGEMPPKAKGDPRSPHAVPDKEVWALKHAARNHK